MKFDVIKPKYKGYEIDPTMVAGKFTVVYDGDEVVFDSIAEAEEFIDEITK